MTRSVLIFAVAGLIGPLIALLIGTDNLAVYNSVAVMWITWGLAAWEESISPAIASMIAVVSNVLIYAAVGAIASISRNLTWKSTIGVAVVAGTWFFSQMLHGSITAFLVSSAVWIGALVLTVVPTIDRNTS